MKENEKLEVLKSIKLRQSHNEHVRVGRKPSLSPIKKTIESDKACAVCGFNKTTLVGDDSFGSNSGGMEIEEFKCQKCNNYSVYISEWG